jgi:hypothetical protein
VALTATAVKELLSSILNHFFYLELQTPRIDASAGSISAIELMLSKFS